MRLERSARLGLFVVVAVALGASAPSAAWADNGASSSKGGGKVFVCKYVGKPGVNERLQTGSNPIDVSVNSIKGYSGIGSLFADAQGNSYVLAADSGQPTPNVSQCPSRTTPPTAPVVTWVSPSLGDVAGGTTVTVTGGGFTGATAVSFGGSAGTDLHVVSDTSLTVVTPAHASATVDVTLTTAIGTSLVVAADNFTYTVHHALSVSAGSGAFGAPTPGPAANSALYIPSGVAVDGAGNIYIADSGNGVVEKVTPAGMLSIVAGTGTNGAPTPGPATSSNLWGPQGVAVDGAGNVYIADSGNSVVEKVTPAGVLSILAGTGTYGAPTPGPATSSELGAPMGLAVDGSGNVYIADYVNNIVEKVTPAGVLSIFAGNGMGDAPTPGPATSSALLDPRSVAADGAGNVYIVDDNEMVEKVTSAGVLSIFAGNGMVGAPTPGPAASSQLAHPHGVAVDGAGNVYIADSGNNLVEKVMPGGVLSIFAGTGTAGAPTPGPATGSPLNYPSGVAADGAGNLYIADSYNCLVEKVAAF
jgi:sugar lactone lactonase YvrE